MITELNLLLPEVGTYKKLSRKFSFSNSRKRSLLRWLPMIMNRLALSHISLSGGSILGFDKGGCPIHQKGHRRGRSPDMRAEGARRRRVWGPPPENLKI